MAIWQSKRFAVVTAKKGRRILNSLKNDCYINNMQSIPACEPTGHNHDPIVRETGQSTMFSHIYVEAAVRDQSAHTEDITTVFEGAGGFPSHIIKIYFARERAAGCIYSTGPKRCRQLLRKDGQLLYEGAEVCQRFW